MSTQQPAPTPGDGTAGGTDGRSTDQLVQDAINSLDPVTLLVGIIFIQLLGFLFSAYINFRVGRLLVEGDF